MISRKPKANSITLLRNRKNKYWADAVTEIVTLQGNCPDANTILVVLGGKK